MTQRTPDGQQGAFGHGYGGGRSAGAGTNGCCSLRAQTVSTPPGSLLSPPELTHSLGFMIAKGQG